MQNWLKNNISAYKRLKTIINEYDFSNVITDSIKSANIRSNRLLFAKFDKKYPNLLTVSEFIFIARHTKDKDIAKQFFCKECGNRVSLISQKCGFHIFCSRKCNDISIFSKEKAKQTSLKRYGVTSPSQSEEIKERIKKTNLERYGVEWSQQNKKIRKKVHQTNIKKYGGISPFSSEEVQDKIKETNLQKYGNVCPRKSDKNHIIAKKIKETCLEKYGCEHPLQSKQVQKKIKKTNLERYGVTCALQGKNAKEKTKKTNLERYGVEWAQQNKKIRDKTIKTNRKKYSCDYVFQSGSIKEKIRKTNLSKYGVDYISQSDTIKEKIKETNLERYGVENPTQNKEVLHKVYNTKKENGTFNISKPEEDLYLLLKKYFPKVLRQYKSELYPFSCDFYVPINNLYIELNANWTHGDEPYNKRKKSHQEILKDWKKKAKKSDFYRNAIHVWTERDPKKVKIAKENKLNYKAFYSLEEAKEWLNTLYNKSYYKELEIQFNREKLLKEYSRIQSTESSYNKLPNTNEIVLYFQQKEFFKREKEIWKDTAIRYKLIANRIKYIEKGLGQLTNREILRGFKISGIVNGYSHFSPQWLRKFIQDYNIKSIYDPCGGWGHRLVSLPLNFKYIYNDINKNTYNNCIKIAKFLGMKNKVFYNNDCSNFYPNKFVDKIDAVFTCPPYHNVEVYSDKGSENLSYKEYLNWWSNTVEQSIRLNPKYFAFVISNKYEEDLSNICLFNELKLVESNKLGKSYNHFNRSSKMTSYEVLLVFKC